MVAFTFEVATKLKPEDVVVPDLDCDSGAQEKAWTLWKVFTEHTEDILLT